MRRPDTNTTFQAGPRDLVEGALSLGSSIFTESLTTMRVATGLGALVGLVLVAIALWKRNDAAIPWIGLLLYGGLCLALIARGGRLLFLSTTYIPSRYASLAAVFWIGLFGLAGVVLRWRWFMLLPAAALVVAALSLREPGAGRGTQPMAQTGRPGGGLVLGPERGPGLHLRVPRNGRPAGVVA